MPARSNRDAAIVDGKLSRLHEPHVAPITELVEQLRKERATDSVPYVDPTLGGVRARVLFLLETPARAAALKSQMLSPDNDDPTAENLWKFYEESGLPRARAVHWNAVPWFMGTVDKNKGASIEDLKEGLIWLGRFRELLPELRLVVTMGGIAQRAFALHLLQPESRLLPWLAVAHPSDRVLRTNPELRGGIQMAFAKAAQSVGE